jgi:pimeloyl-ACP methyl ester carboxylesterase
MTSARRAPSARALRWAVAAAAVVAAMAGAGPAAAADPFGPCPGRSDVECATLAVPLDRSGVLPGQVAIHVERIRTSGASRGVLLALVGGPGQAASDVRAELRADLAGPAAGRDLILIDQRGTGLSGVLTCRSLAQAGIATPPAEAVRRCAEEIGPARDTYTTLQSALDIEDVRAFIGAETMTVYGVSYGTRVAQEYARRFPARVSGLILDSVVPADGSEPFRQSSLRAVGPALKALCAGGACRGITRDPGGDLARLVHRLSAHPLNGDFIDPRGRTRRIRVTSGDILDILLAGDLDPTVRAGLPAGVRSALEGDPALLLRIVGREFASSGNEAASVAPALFVDTECEEEPVPWDRAAATQDRVNQAVAAAGALPAGALGPFGRGVALQAPVINLCLLWPAPAAAAPAPPPPLPDVPVLLLSGSEDVRTPPEDARATAALFPRAQLVVVPGVAHAVLPNDLSRCASRAVTAFLAGAPAAACGRARRFVTPFPRPPRSIRGVDAAPGTTGPAGRTLAAFALTLDDVSRTAFLAGIDAPSGARSVRAGGLRGGSFVSTRSSLRVSGVVFVPGVAVSGHTVRGGSVWTVSGPRAAAGRLTLSADRVTGTLGGVRISRPLPILRR